MEHAFATIDFDPNIEFEVDVSLRRRATETSGDRRRGPALREQLMDGGEARGLFTRRVSVGRTTGRYTAVKQEESTTRCFPTC